MHLCAGKHLTVHAEVLRLGSRVAESRMEFLGVDGKLVSVRNRAGIDP